MKNWTQCKHYWQLIGPKHARWFDGHAMARCKHCRSWTVVDMDDIGPCFHSIGQRQSIYASDVNIPLPPASPDSPMVEDNGSTSASTAPQLIEHWLDHEQPCYCEDCSPYRNSHPKDCQCYHCFNGSEQYERR